MGNEYITLKEYADSRGVSYESVRQMVARHEAELEGHISKQHNVRYIDNAGAEMLNEWRKIGQVVVYRQEKADYVKELEAQVQELREELLKRVSLIESLQAKIIELQIEKEAGTKLLLDKQRLEMELAQAKELEKGMIMQIKGEADAREEAENNLKKAEEEKQLLNNTLERSKTETQEAKKEAEEQRNRADQIENSYQKTIFGLYRKKKD